MRSADRAALRDFLGRPSLRRLVTEAREKVERTGAVRGSVRIDEPSEEERRAVADLLGLRAVPPPDRPLRVQLGRLDRTLRESRFAVGLEAALEAHGGELRNRPAEKAAEEERWRRFWDEARGRPLPRKFPELETWLDDVSGTGLYRRLATQRSEAPHDLLDRVFAVLGELFSGAGGSGVRLAVLASRCLGDSHALDVGHRVPALVLRALALLHGRPLPRTAVERRELWAAAGVVCDDLSCDVLVLGVAPESDGLLHRYLSEHAAAGEPVRVTLRQLAGAPPVVLPSAKRVFVCENPAVVSVAADVLGRRSPPLVCLAGHPDTAALVLLRALVDGGSELLYHGDFDWGGLRIANALGRSLPFRPWRFTAADYLVAAEHAERIALDDRAVDADWDADLRPAMEAKGVAVEEEAVVESLLEDLTRRGPVESGSSGDRAVDT